MKNQIKWVVLGKYWKEIEKNKDMQRKQDKMRGS